MRKTCLRRPPARKTRRAETRDLGQEPKHIVIAGVVRTALANPKVKRSALTQEAMEKVVHALSGS